MNTFRSLSSVVSSFASVCLLSASLFSGSAFASQDVSIDVLSLNMHGYHPMGEGRRFIEDRSSRISGTQAHLFYFTLSEIERGHARQLHHLSRSIGELQPTVVFLQEVGGGHPHSNKDCREFYADGAGDWFGKNSALRLRDRLKSEGLAYDVALACRGNAGWVTNGDTFKKQRVVRKAEGSKTGYETVFDFGSNPYPGGMIVEGTAILVQKPWSILDTLKWNLPVAGTSEKFFFQSARIRKNGESGWWLVVNVHGGHKVQHFEQAVAVRKALADYVLSHSERRSYKGTIIGGDLNARLYRPSLGQREISGIPWEIRVAGEFDYGAGATDWDFDLLKTALWNLNVDPYYKPWASIGESAEARARINGAVDRFAEFARGPSASAIPLREIFDEAIRLDRCRPPATPALEGSCECEDRIDLVFADPSFRPAEASVVFSKNSYEDPSGVSDHPGIYLKLLAK